MMVMMGMKGRVMSEMPWYLKSAPVVMVLRVVRLSFVKIVTRNFCKYLKG